MQSVLNRLLEIGLIGAVVLAVASFGGTEPISWAIVQGVLLILGLVLVARPAAGCLGSRSVPMLGPGALLSLVGIQWLGSYRDKIGLDSHAIATHEIGLAVYLVAFYLVLAVASVQRTKRRVVLALVFLGLFEAIYGLIQYLAGWQYIFTYKKRFYTESATGTYVNHNHFAGFLEMVIPLTIALGLYYWQKAQQDQVGASVPTLPKLLGRPEILKSMLLAFAGSVLFLAVIYSQSRMGLISCATSLVVMAAVLLAGKRRGAVSAVLILVLLAVGVGFACWIGVEPIISRFEKLPGHEYLFQGHGGRLAIWEDTGHLIRAYPWVGVGLGCFEFAYPKFQTVFLNARVDHAHNDYMELTADLGVLGVAILLGMIVTVAIRTLRAFHTARESLTRALALGTFGGIVALLLHSLTDFNLYIPANGLVFSLVLGLGYSTAAEPSGET